MPKYVPDRCGSVWQEHRAVCYGIASDPDGNLVALSVQAPQTLTEKFHYELQGQEARFVIHIPDAGLRYTYSHKSHFTIERNPIPDTGEVSMLMLNDSLFGIDKELGYTHVFYEDLEKFKHELYMRVKSMVYTPCLKEWKDYLYLYGTATSERQQRSLAGRLTNKRDVKPGASWQAAGFDIGYIRVEREAWEALISSGLNKGLIKFNERNGEVEKNVNA